MNKQYFMQKPPISGAVQTEYDIEDHFKLVVGSIDGLEDIGDVKGVTIEDYADGGTKIHIKHNLDGSVNYKGTDVTMRVYFFGDNRYENWKAFVTYLSGKEVVFTDKERKVQATLYAITSIKAKDPLDKRYLDVSIKFKNLDGRFKTI